MGTEGFKAASVPESEGEGQLSNQEGSEKPESKMSRRSFLAGVGAVAGLSAMPKAAGAGMLDMKTEAVPLVTVLQERLIADDVLAKEIMHDRSIRSHEKIGALLGGNKFDGFWRAQERIYALLNDDELKELGFDPEEESRWLRERQNILVHKMQGMQQGFDVGTMEEYMCDLREFVQESNKYIQFANLSKEQMKQALQEIE